MTQKMPRFLALQSEKGTILKTLWGLKLINTGTKEGPAPQY
jgi:hypothetical protein